MEGNVTPTLMENEVFGGLRLWEAFVRDALCVVMATKDEFQLEQLREVTTGEIRASFVPGRQILLLFCKLSQGMLRLLSVTTGEEKSGYKQKDGNDTRPVRMNWSQEPGGWG